ncbi:gamma-glutamyl-gamma-aminobutyrate hydrolase family protein [Clostridium lundense]|uniref:gamma-glutamyl-gamma-aminobutyrate hydrolase family protein n=1 Tax=Clostridium lundense TaxID=319475 RepID=UPI00047F7556|nr:gamma-glutamyl-gamma-aminobutyrate hydrolase family protein [Clostridium lundense]
MGKKLIGIVADIEIVKRDGFPSYQRIYSNEDYIEAVIQCGGVPIILPFLRDYSTVKEQIKLVDKVIITGGCDVNPLMYGEESEILSGEIIPERDNYDMMVIKSCEELKKPILGICRGVQSLNVAYGGTLYQHLPSRNEFYIQHNQKSRYDVGIHTIIMEKGTKLQQILGDSIIVNSFHHQAVKDLAPGFVVSAKSKDGVIEGIEKLGDVSVIGVQWHPEKMFLKCEQMKMLFYEFINNI